MAKTLYKKITITVKHDDGDVVIDCLRVKGDKKLAVGNMVDVIGELSKVNGVLQFDRGCEAITNAEAILPTAEVLQALRELADGDKYGKDNVKMSGEVTEIVKAVSDIPHKITLYSGVLSMFVAGVFYLFMSDLSFGNTAEWLILATVLSLGAAILFVLSANYPDKKAVVYSLKVCGLILSVGFVLYLHLFMGSETYLAALDKFQKALNSVQANGMTGAQSILMSSCTMIVALVLSYVAIAAQVSNVVVTAVIKDE